MKKHIIYLASAAIALGSLTACDDSWSAIDDSNGEGTVMITTTVRSDVKVNSRATTEESLKESLELWISNSKGLVRKYNGQDNIPSSIKLLSGNYTVQAWAGDSVAASFDEKCFKGTTSFLIEAGKTTPVDVVCKIANVVASVNYTDAVDDVLSDYTMTVGHYYGTLTFEGKDTRKGYFMMNQYAKDLEWTLNGKLSNGEEFTKSGVIEAPESATEYVLNVKYDHNSDVIGGGYLTVEVDPQEIDVEEEVEISLAPVIRGMGFNINEPLQKEFGTVGRRSVFVAASAALKSLVLESEYFTPTLGAADFDLLQMTDAVKAQLEAAGVTFVYKYDDTDDVSSLKLNFEEELTNNLPDGKYAFSIAAQDVNGKKSSAVFNIVISNDPVKMEEVTEGDVWSTKATFYAELTQDDATNVMFDYRPVGTQEWLQVAPDQSSARGVKYSATVTGLLPDTEYEYTISCTDKNGEYFQSEDIRTFTTGATPQLPNAGFEEWTTEKAPYLVYAPGTEMFWDTGNHGSSTVGGNVTVPDSEIKHSGNYSIKLASQFVGMFGIGKFAAGNVFIGKYLKTDGMDGILGWGRPFTARPTALKGYIKYTPAKIEYSENSAYVKGEMDRGIIYVALLDGSKKQGDSAYPEYPVVVKTKSSERHLFDKNSSDVIAYGEMIFSEATNGLIEFTIPIEYNRTDEIPSYIVLTASASQGGDYFSGGASVMNIDDLELVYE